MSRVVAASVVLDDDDGGDDVGRRVRNRRGVRQVR